MTETTLILSSNLLSWPLPSSVMPPAGSVGLARPLTCPGKVEVVVELRVKHL